VVKLGQAGTQEMVAGVVTLVVLGAMVLEGETVGAPLMAIALAQGAEAVEAVAVLG
jgi:hypothetical protein